MTMQKTVDAFEYPLVVDAGLGRLAVQTDFAEHVEQLIEQVLFTNPGERINRPDFGCGIRRMVFAPNSQESASLAQVTISQALELWLGSLIKVEEVKVRALEEVLEIRIGYLLKIKRERRYLNVEVNV
jgi:phage baseplate assembly protein W